jgi:hypothetical protein
MKKVFTWIWDRIKWLLTGIPLYLSLSLLISLIVGLVTWDVVYGFFTIFGIIVLLTIFVFGRQIYWRITKTGEYANNDKKE